MTPQTVGTPNVASTVVVWKQLMYMLKYSPGRSTSTWSSCVSSSSSALGGLTLSWTKTGRAWTSSGDSLPVRSCIQSEPKNFSESESESESASASESASESGYSTSGRWSCLQMVQDSHSHEYVRTLSTL